MTAPVTQATAQRWGRRARLVASALTGIAAGLHIRNLRRIAKFWQGQAIRERNMVDLLRNSEAAHRIDIEPADPATPPDQMAAQVTRHLLRDRDERWWLL